ncbi:hypothetical protein FPZ43_01895 [Mucilaginibacter pallidiroseus]|uniref:Uncharacterized protein n=1 Tax=Mucilaginibacter pallidiroseus TaxID=2599295 RepID=A0A563UIX4_9SPHI|nr:hypothetical protein [Mucilaginibacter pallidiroseus]TWR31253.1 hypothetical protein FPZ43_01895 [Mucilaginibacter pallidiroseus]
MEANNQTQPNAYRVEDDNNLEEKDLRKEAFMFGSEEKQGNEPGMEAEGAGGHSFGKNNSTPSGDDKNNPSQTAGYSNEYFRRTEPSEEHPENNNFKDPNQLGQSNYTAASGNIDIGSSENQGGDDTEQTDDREQNRTESDETFQEGTADGNDNVNIPGPNETPDQQKVAE